MALRGLFALACACCAAGVALAAAPPHKAHEPITPIPSRAAIDARKLSLGERLFHDPRLSADGRVACATCHPLAEAGTDHRSHVVTVAGKELLLSTPTVFNSALSTRHGWLGTNDSFRALLDQKVADRFIFNSDWAQITQRLALDSAYAISFQSIYASGPTAAAIRDATAEFLGSLVTTESRFDRYLRGDETALTDEEKAGYRRFKSHGCIACHQGVNVGGNVFQRLGVFDDYFAARGVDETADIGRYLVTGRERDRHVFRVPSLRNVGATAPYFHDGSAQSLDDAVYVMARFQLGQQPNDKDVQLIVKFLKTLTGYYQGRSL
jgi:cytochrome c peroxidase